MPPLCFIISNNLATLSRAKYLDMIPPNNYVNNNNSAENVQ